MHWRIKRLDELVKNKIENLLCCKNNITTTSSEKYIACGEHIMDFMRSPYMMCRVKMFQCKQRYSPCVFALHVVLQIF